MESLFMILFLISVLCMLVGLIKPSLVLHWGKKRTRGRAVGWYFLFAFICMMLGASTINSKQHQQNEQRVNSHEVADNPTNRQPIKATLGTQTNANGVIKIDLDGDKEAKKSDSNAKHSDEPRLISLYCTFTSNMRSIRREADKKFGVNAHNALKVGDIILAGQDTALAIAQSGTIKSENELHGKIESISTIKKGARFKILRVIESDEGQHWYEAKDLRTSKHGYIRSAALFWYDTLDRSSRHEKKVSAWVEPRYAKLGKEIFTDNGLDRWVVDDLATKGKWRLQCKGGEKASALAAQNADNEAANPEKPDGNVQHERKANFQYTVKKYEDLAHYKAMIDIELINAVILTKEDIAYFTKEKGLEYGKDITFVSIFLPGTYDGVHPQMSGRYNKEAKKVDVTYSMGNFPKKYSKLKQEYYKLLPKK